MPELNSKMVKALSLLFRILWAGEKGYATAAMFIHSPAIKILFKSFAQQRANFKSEILNILQQAGVRTNQRSSLRGIIHRGSFSIFTGMTIGEENQERVCLRETARGERVAVRTYQHVLEQALPPDMREIVTRQAEQVRAAAERVDLMRGTGEKQLLARLFGSEKEAMQALEALKDAGISLDQAEKYSLDKDFEQYQGQGATTRETIAAGSFYGALIGGLVGILASIGVVQSAVPQPEFSTALGTISLVILAGILGGIFVVALLAVFLGAGDIEEDQYKYTQIIEHGRFLLLALVPASQVRQAREVLNLAHPSLNEAVIRKIA